MLLWSEDTADREEPKFSLPCQNGNSRAEQARKCGIDDLSSEALNWDMGSEDRKGTLMLPRWQAPESETEYKYCIVLGLQSTESSTKKQTCNSKITESRVKQKRIRNLKNTIDTKGSIHDLKNLSSSRRRNVTKGELNSSELWWPLGCLHSL